MTTTNVGRRRDEILRVVGDEPRVFGFRSRSLLIPMVVGFLLTALAKANIGGTTLLTMLFGRFAGLVCVVVLVGTIVFVKYVEMMEDEHFLTFVIRYWVRRVVAWWKGPYCGAAASPRQPHPLDDVVTFARVTRLAGISWER